MSDRPTGYGGRQCRVAGDDPETIYTILGEPYVGPDGHRWVDLDEGGGVPGAARVGNLLLLPWTGRHMEDVALAYDLRESIQHALDAAFDADVVTEVRALVEAHYKASDEIKLLQALIARADV